MRGEFEFISNRTMFINNRTGRGEEKEAEEKKTKLRTPHREGGMKQAERGDVKYEKEIQTYKEIFQKCQNV